jgi:hypothetical protein
MEGTGVRVDNVAQNDLEPTAAIASTTGKVSSAANLVAGGAKLQIANVSNDLLPRKGFAVSMWAKPVSASTKDLGRLTWELSPQAQNIGINTGAAIVGTSTSFVMVNHNVTFAPGVWYHALYYFDANNSVYGLFVNGVNKKETTSATHSLFADWLSDNDEMHQHNATFNISALTADIALDEVAFFDLSDYAGGYTLAQLSTQLYNGGTGKFYRASGIAAESSSSDSGESRSSNSSSSSSSSSSSAALALSTSSSDSSSSGGLESQRLEWWWRANELIEDITATPTVSTRQATSEQSAHYDYLSFSATVDQYAYTMPWRVPDDATTDFATGGVWRLGVIWAGDNASSNTVEWQFGIKSATSDESVIVTPFSTQVTTVADADGGATYDVYFENYLFSAADDINLNDYFQWRIGRLGSSGVDDDYAGTANLIAFGWQNLSIAGNNAQWS